MEAQRPIKPCVSWGHLNSTVTGDTGIWAITLKILLTVAWTVIHTTQRNADIKCGTQLLTPVVADMEMTNIADKIRIQWHTEMTHNIVGQSTVDLEVISDMVIHTYRWHMLWHNMYMYDNLLAKVNYWERWTTTNCVTLLDTCTANTCCGVTCIITYNGFGKRLTWPCWALTTIYGWLVTTSNYV